ncbi:MAG: alpha/beta fold hydrolase, partial [Actinomycetes bacterium]
MPTVRAGAVEVAFEQAGAGDPIVFLPGTGLRAATWQRQVEHFADRYRCLSVDLRGSGDTVG